MGSRVNLKERIKMKTTAIQFGKIRKGSEREDLLKYLEYIEKESSTVVGVESVSSQAKKHGYATDAEMWVDVAFELYKEIESIVACVMTSFISKWMNEFYYMDFKTDVLGDQAISITLINLE